MKTITAFDIGGTTLKMGLVSSEGDILQHEKMTTPDFDGELILAGISEYTKKHDVAGVAISAPGYINPKTGFITMGGAIRAFDDFPLREYLEEKTGLPVTVENDANCVALCEKWVGGAQDLDNFLCMTIGQASAAVFSSMASCTVVPDSALASSATYLATDQAATNQAPIR